MTTVEIAEQTGKRHDHVMRDTRVMLIENYGEDSLPRFGESYIADNGQTYECYSLGKDETLCLSAGYSSPLRMKIIKRLGELESKQLSAIPDFTNPAAAARAWADEVEVKQALQVQAIENKPLIDFANTIKGTDKKVSIGDIAKLHGKIGRNNLFWKMREEKILISNGRDHNKPYQTYMDSGYFEVTENVVKRDNHADMIVFTTYVTGGGQPWLIGWINKWMADGLDIPKKEKKPVELNVVKVGDFVTYGSDTIKVEKIRSLPNNGVFYIGPKYTISGRLYANKATTLIYKSRVDSINGESLK